VSLSFDSFVLMLLLSPFAVALLAPAIAGATGRAAGWILALVPAGLCAALATTIGDIAAGRPLAASVAWVPSLELRFGVLVDGLGLVFALLVTGIGALIVLYSASYLDGHPQRGRFLAFLFAFMGAMLGLVLADSLVTLFVFWELTSIASFLLIGFGHERQAARRGAIQALIVTAIGGLALMAGGVLLWSLTGTWEIAALAGAPGLVTAGWAYPLVLGFMLAAAFTKSAQWPFHFWLPNAMEAPTPVSAYLHSATMVQAGIYLLARLTPLLSGSPLWQALLAGFGGTTLLWGALTALRQTDLKQMLAHTTIASLGLTVLLLGLGGAAGVLAACAYFVAHALYKAALFLVTGIIDHGTGTRDITVLGGLRDSLTISFICAALAGLSMLGVPPLLGYLAKEQVYAALGFADPWAIVTVATLLVGNALLGAVAIAVALKPFMGAPKPTPETPHEGGFALWIGPALLGLLGLAVVFALGAYGDFILAPMAAAVLGGPVENHLTYAVDPAAPALWLSLATWALAALVYWRLDWSRARLDALARLIPWSWDKGFDQAMFGLIRFGGAWSRAFHNGRLEIYVIIAFASVALVLLLPLLALGGLPALPRLAPMTFYEWGAVGLAALGVVIVAAARTRLGAIVALGIQGLAVALLFLLFGAPDLAFTQFLVETLSVVILALVMTRLSLSAADPRPWEDWLRDGALALVTGVAATLVLLRVLEGAFDDRLSRFFIEHSVATAHGHNIVNVILVDFRGLDTLGEISVVMTAGIAVLALLRRQHKRRPAATRRARTGAAA
jgi:multicomponent Na+:H+ antiporter subunit A